VYCPLITAVVRVLPASTGLRVGYSTTLRALPCALSVSRSGTNFCVVDVRGLRDRQRLLFFSPAILALPSDVRCLWSHRLVTLTAVVRYRPSIARVLEKGAGV